MPKAGPRKASDTVAKKADSANAPMRTPVRAPSHRTPTPPVTAEPGTAENQTPNQTVARVLMQVLAAKKLAEGISFEITDNEVRVFGEAGSEEARQKIISVIEKGREARRIDASNLRIKK